MDRGRPAYDLEEIKKVFSGAEDLRLSVTALKSMVALSLRKDDVVKVIQSLSRSNFYKSMSSYADHRVWQDVYHAECRGLVLYLKFTVNEQGYLIISFKEK